jgi:hypothetical protein
MSLRDVLASAIQSAISPLVSDLGCRVAIYRATVTSTADATPVRTYALDASWSSVDVLFAPGQRQTGTDESDSIAKPFGVRSTAKGTITIIRPVAGFPSVAAFDGFKVLDGPYAGYTWLAEADGVADLIGALMEIRVIAAPAGAIT